MNNNTEYEQISVKLLKNRVILRVFKYLFELFQYFSRYKKVFLALYQDKDLEMLSRGQILSFIKENNPDFTTVRASNILNDLITKKFIKTTKNIYGIEKYDTQFVIIKKMVFAKAAPIAEYLNEDIQSVISALKILRGFKVKITVPLPLPLVKSSRVPKNTNSWNLTQDGITAGKYFIEVFQERAPIEKENNPERTSEASIRTVGSMYEETCSKILTIRNEVNQFIKKIVGIQEVLQVKLNECSTIRGRSINEIFYSLSGSEVENKNISKDTEDLINTIKFVNFNMGVLARLKVLLNRYNKNLRIILDAQKGVFDKKDFIKIVYKMHKNFSRLKSEFDIPRQYTFKQWNQFTEREKDFSFTENKKKSLNELLKINFNEVLNIEHIYDLKFNIERFIEESNGHSKN